MWWLAALQAHIQTFRLGAGVGHLALERSPPFTNITADLTVNSISHSRLCLVAFHLSLHSESISVCPKKSIASAWEGNSKHSWSYKGKNISTAHYLKWPLRSKSRNIMYIDAPVFDLNLSVEDFSMVQFFFKLSLVPRYVEKLVQHAIKSYNTWAQ